MEKDERILQQEEKHKPHQNVIEKRLEELRQAGMEIDEEVARKYLIIREIIACQIPVPFSYSAIQAILAAYI